MRRFLQTLLNLFQSYLLLFYDKPLLPTVSRKNPSHDDNTFDDRHLQQPYWTNGEKVNTLDLYSNYRGSNPLLSAKFVCLDN